MQKFDLEFYASYGGIMDPPASDCEKILLAATQMLLGHRYYGSPLNANQLTLTMIIEEASKRLAKAEGSERLLP